MRTLLLATLAQIVVTVLFYIGLDRMMSGLTGFQLQIVAFAMLIGSILPLTLLNTILYVVITLSLRFIKSDRPAQQAVLTSIVFSVLLSFAIIFLTDIHDRKIFLGRALSLVEWFIFIASWLVAISLIFAFVFIRYNRLETEDESADDDHGVLDR